MKNKPQDDTLDKISKYLAREIFKVGDEHGEEITRIEFKTGTYPDEKSTGGLCEVALVNVIKESLAALLIKSLK